MVLVILEVAPKVNSAAVTLRNGVSEHPDTKEVLNHARVPITCGVRSAHFVTDVQCSVNQFKNIL
jgi:hypothetical protein